MVLVDRHNVVNGTPASLTPLTTKSRSLPITKPFEAVMVNDLRVAHGVSAILPASAELKGHRDMLVATFKRK